MRRSTAKRLSPRRRSTSRLVLRGALNSIGDRLGAFRKTDRLPAVSETSVARQTLRVPTSTRVHDRELVRVRPYVRVTGNLSLTTSDLSANIPPFNPQKLLADAVSGGDDTRDGGARRRGVLRHLRFRPASRTPQGGAGGLRHQFAAVQGQTVDAVAARRGVTRVRDVANALGSSGPLLANADVTSGLKLSYAAEGDPDEYFGFAGARRAGERHAVAEDDDASQRRRLERTRGRRQERRNGRFDPARARRPARRDQSRPCRARSPVATAD